MSKVSQTFTIKDWAEEDRPREKLLKQGRRHLTDAELVAILLGSGNSHMSALDLAKHILKSVNNDLDRLAVMHGEELKKFNGIGEAKAVNIISALELGRRRKVATKEQRSSISGSEDIYELMKPRLADLPYEEFWIVITNRANRVIKVKMVSSGGMSGTTVDAKVIFKMVLEENGTSLILVHNHPSGNLNPSESDIIVTKKIKAAGKLLDIDVLDHIIFTDRNGHFSFSDNNMMK